MATFKILIPAGPIWNQQDAEKKCPVVCAAHFGKWTGQWTTVVPNEMSVCECELEVNRKGSDEITLFVPAGPIWNNDPDAKEKGPIVCASYGGEWTGQWRTTVQGKMSECECKFRF